MLRIHLFLLKTVARSCIKHALFFTSFTGEGEVISQFRAWMNRASGISNLREKVHIEKEATLTANMREFLNWSYLGSAQKMGYRAGKPHEW